MSEWRVRAHPRCCGDVFIAEPMGGITRLTPAQARQHARHLDLLADQAGDDHASRRTYTERARQVRAAADEVEK